MQKDWRTEGVRVVRAAALRDAKEPDGTGRTTVFDYDGSGGTRTWIGSVVLGPKVKTGGHHHGRHEVSLCVVKGRTEIRWGERLEFVADLEPGDWAYFPPYVPHQEHNPSETEPLEIIAVRSDNERIFEKLDCDEVEAPEAVG